MKAKSLLLLIVITLLASCARVPPELRPKKIDLTLKREVYLDMRWKANFDDDAQGKRFRLEPAFDNDRIYISSTNGKVQARNFVDGDVIWSTDLEDQISSGTSFSGDAVYVGSTSGVLYCLDSQTGELKWKKTLPSEPLAPAASEKDVVVVQLLDGKILAFDGEGDELWKYEASLPVLTLRGHARPQIFGRNIITGLANGRVIALDRATGRLQWESRVAVPKGRTEIERIVDVDHAPLIDVNKAFAVSYQGRLVAIDLSNGRQFWSKAVSSYGGVNQGLGNLFVSDDQSVVQAYSKQSGQIKWQQSAYQRRGLGTPVLLERYLVVNDFEGYLHLLDPVDGRPLGREQVDEDGIASSLVVHNNKLFFYTHEGDFYAYAVEAR